jgi:hypothetical protein
MMGRQPREKVPGSDAARSSHWRGRMSYRSVDADHQVLVVARSNETIDGLQAYLRSVGIPSHSARSIQRAAEHLDPAVSSVIAFTDDDGLDEVVASITKLRRSRPNVLLILITREPQRLQAAVGVPGRSPPPLVLPKASFGWSILDAIRSRGAAPS